jgi:hypothetical protein
MSALALACAFALALAGALALTVALTRAAASAGAGLRRARAGAVARAVAGARARRADVRRRLAFALRGDFRRRLHVHAAHGRLVRDLERGLAFDGDLEVVVVRAPDLGADVLRLHRVGEVGVTHAELLAHHLAARLDDLDGLLRLLLQIGDRLEERLEARACFAPGVVATRVGIDHSGRATQTAGHAAAAGKAIATGNTLAAGHLAAASCQRDHDCCY